MERQRSQSAWVRAFFWSRTGRGGGRRKKERCEEERRRVAWKGRIGGCLGSETGCWDTRDTELPLLPLSKVGINSDRIRPRGVTSQRPADPRESVRPHASHCHPLALGA